MKVCYYSSLVSERLYKKLYTKKEKPGMQAQTFNRLIVEGLIKNNIFVKCFSVIPTSKELFDLNYLNEKSEHFFKYYKVFNFPIIKDVYILLKSYFQTLYNLNIDKEIVCVIDVLCSTSGLGASLACKHLKKDCIGIVTDLPEFLTSNKLYINMVYKTIKNCNKYIFLTQPMNNLLNKNNKPYQIVEGLCIENDFKTNNREKVFMYAGSLDKVNGISTLIEAFLQVDTNFQLHIYGSGDYEEQINKISKEKTNIKFFGLVDRDIILEKIKNVYFLINPRSTSNEMVKYSFPSKNMEYLASGTPFLCTKLPCIPSDYLEYINLFENDDVEGIKKGLEKALNVDYSTLVSKAEKGKEFIIKNKNNISQTKKIINLIGDKI